jgi:hypothetical protein
LSPQIRRVRETKDDIQKREEEEHQESGEKDRTAEKHGERESQQNKLRKQSVAKVL